jgi:hypothetical protein
LFPSIQSGDNECSSVIASGFRSWSVIILISQPFLFGTYSPGTFANPYRRPVAEERQRCNHAFGCQAARSHAEPGRCCRLNFNEPVNRFLSASVSQNLTNPSAREILRLSPNRQAHEGGYAEAEGSGSEIIANTLTIHDVEPEQTGVSAVSAVGWGIVNLNGGTIGIEGSNSVGLLYYPKIFTRRCQAGSVEPRRIRRPCPVGPRLLPSRILPNRSSKRLLAAANSEVSGCLRLNRN